MRVLSLFDGISCGMVALERAGIDVEVYDAYEIDENAIKVSQDNYPQIHQKGDVFCATYTKHSYDLLIGGSPCTYWSIAGVGHREREVKQEGLGWDLFSQYVRALREVEPKWFLYENNASMSPAIKESITRELKVEPIMIDSADFSAQTRKRLYWTNIPLLARPEPSQLVFEDIICKDESQYKCRNFTKYADTERVSANGTHSWDTSGKGYYSQANRARATNIKMNTLCNTKGGNDKNNIYLGNHKCRKILPIEAERMQTLPDNYTKAISSESKRVGLCGNGWTVDVIVYLLSGLKK